MGVILKCRNFVLVGIFLLILIVLAGCSKKANEKIENVQITGAVIDDFEDDNSSQNDFENDSLNSSDSIKNKTENNLIGNQELTSKNENDSLQENKTNVNLKKSMCVPQWKCVSEKYRGLVDEECKWKSLEQCDYLCINGACTQQLKCVPNALRCNAIDVEKCGPGGGSWTLKETCEDDCFKGECILKRDSAQGSQQIITNNSTNTTDSNNESSNNNSVSCSNCISVYSLHYDAAGNDCQNLNDEYIILRNNCTVSCDLNNWKIKDESTNLYIFQNFIFASDSYVNLSTGCGSNTSMQLHWCSHGSGCNAIWNNDHDSLALINSSGSLLLNYTY